MLQADVDHSRFVSSAACGSTQLCHETPHAHAVHVSSGPDLTSMSQAADCLGHTTDGLCISEAPRILIMSIRRATPRLCCWRQVFDRSVLVSLLT